ncbi:hypothetical protein SAMN04488135_1164 [Pollutimonas bauzanensis]|uniref:Uncharacterized protein n=1 Tax=Pollutimonas bauzanensis TaxID=658167 RepID=A0A1M5ZM02_9BURK|nr:hypothetical protein SAMN04488135_1164 [Pollutimonas bauzanensis]
MESHNDTNDVSVLSAGGNILFSSCGFRYVGDQCGWGYSAG